MQVSVTARHGNINDEVRDHISRKSEKLLTFFERVFSIDVTVEFNKDRIRAEILVDAEHRHNLVAHDEGDDVLSTFDRAYHKMEQQIRKYKQKIQDHRRDRSMNDIAEESLRAGEETTDEGGE